MKKSHDNPQPDSAQAWIKHAMSDLALARLALGSEDVLPEQICFHAQQAAEKSLKAVLLYKKINFPFIHDIEELIEIAKHGGLRLPDWMDDMAMLTPYAVETRYPGQWEPLEENDVNEALKIAQQAIEWAREIICGG